MNRSQFGLFKKTQIILSKVTSQPGCKGHDLSECTSRLQQRLSANYFASAYQLTGNSRLLFTHITHAQTVLYHLYLYSCTQQIQEFGLTSVYAVLRFLLVVWLCHIKVFCRLCRVHIPNIWKGAPMILFLGAVEAEEEPVRIQSHDF